jgi:hypothetical protein
MPGENLAEISKYINDEEFLYLMGDNQLPNFLPPWKQISD